MNMEKKIVTDQELFSELVENPIHPLQIHKGPPFVDENSPTSTCKFMVKRLDYLEQWTT